MKGLLEVCVDSVESALAAERGGADRLEVCANLIIGGTSPGPAFIREVRETVGLPMRVLLRPRFGDFCYSAAEKRVLLAEIAQCRELGAEGVVIGALTPEGELDLPFLADCMEEAGALHVTLHRAFDLTRDAFRALEQAVGLGMDTVLTSGQQASAQQGAEMLGRLHRAAAGRIHILAGAGVNAGNLPLLAREGITQFHCSGKREVDSPMRFRRAGVPMGLPLADEYLRSCTDEAAIRAAREALNQLAR